MSGEKGNSDQSWSFFRWSVVTYGHWSLIDCTLMIMVPYGHWSTANREQWPWQSPQAILVGELPRLQQSMDGIRPIPVQSSVAARGISNLDIAPQNYGLSNWRSSCNASSLMLTSYREQQVVQQKAAGSTSLLTNKQPLPTKNWTLSVHSLPLVLDQWIDSWCISVLVDLISYYYSWL